MKLYSVIIAALAAFAFNSATAAPDAKPNRQKPPRILEASVLKSSPEGQGLFKTDNLNTMLENWTEVEKKQFYYESMDKTIKFQFPYQEGGFVTTDSRKGSWRFYHCAGLRIQLEGESIRYFLPPNVAVAIPKHPQETTKQNKSEQTTPGKPFD